MLSFQSIFRVSKLWREKKIRSLIKAIYYLILVTILEKVAGVASLEECLFFFIKICIVVFR